jgi:hypothetical protein
MTHASDVVFVQLTGTSLTDSGMIADALARSGADLFNIEGRATWVRDGVLVGVNRDVLPDLVAKYVFTKTLVMRGSKPEVTRVPVMVDEQQVRAILTGTDSTTRGGGTVAGGSLASRLPRALSV